MAKAPNGYRAQHMNILRKTAELGYLLSKLKNDLESGKVKEPETKFSPALEVRRGREEEMVGIEVARKLGLPLSEKDAAILKERIRKDKKSEEYAAKLRSMGWAG